MYVCMYIYIYIYIYPDMVNHFLTLVKTMKTNIAEIPEQQKQFEEFFTININLTTS